MFDCIVAHTFGFDCDSSECLKFTSPISSMVWGLTERASLPALRKSSMAVMLECMDLLRLERRASKRCCICPSMADFTGRVDTVTQSTLTLLQGWRGGHTVSTTETVKIQWNLSITNLRIAETSITRIPFCVSV